MLKKTLIFFLTFVMVYIANFFIPRLMPGDSLSYLGVENSDEVFVAASKAEIDHLREYYGLDKPVFTQFLEYVKDNLHGDFGISIQYKKPVSEVIAGRLPWTLYIMLTTLVLSMLIGTVLALLCISRRKLDAWLFHSMSVFTEIPSFLIGIVLLFLVAANVKGIPISGNLTPFAEYDSVFAYLGDLFLHSLMPITAMVIVTVPKFFFTARSSFMTVRNKKYVMNAEAKGLGRRRILFRYILLNGIFPMVSTFFLSVGQTIGGTILVENVFAYPGLGKILKEAVQLRDYALLQGVFMLSTVMVLMSSYISDIINNYIAKETDHD